MGAGTYLAIWGAVTGTVGTIIAIANLRRDRPSLRVARYLRLDGPEPEEFKLVARVTNVGKQPIAVIQVGFATAWKTNGRLRRSAFPVAASLPPRERGAPGVHVREDPTILQPGDVITVSEPLVGAAKTRRPFATDVLGRVSWGPAVSAEEERSFRQVVEGN